MAGINKVRQFGNRTIPTLKDKVPYSDIVNDVTTGGTQKPLSAQMGKDLNTKVSQEVADRQQAILDLKGGVTPANSTLKKLEDNVNLEIQNRKDAITQEVSDRDAAIAAEANLRTQEAKSLKGFLESQIGNVASDLLTSNKQAGTALSLAKTELSNEINQLDTEVANNDTASVERDSTLTKAIEELTTTVETNRQTAANTLSTEATTRADADTALSSRLAAIESVVTAGVAWKGSLADMTALDGLDESVVAAGQAYYVTAEKDVFVVLADPGGDYKPSSWTSKSFLKIADFKELSGLVTAEKNRAVAEEARLEAAINAEVATRVSEIARLEGLINSEATTRKIADETLQGNIDTETTARTNADKAIEEAYKAAATALGARVDKEVQDRATAVADETQRATTQEQFINNKLDQEIQDRKDTITKEVDDRTKADEALDARLDTLEADKSTAGSVANAEHNARVYADLWIPQLKMEGLDGNLAVVADAITVTYAPMPDGVLTGEVIVYGGDNDSEAIAVNISNIQGSSISLDVVTPGEFDGKRAKVHYLFREGDQAGAGMGVAGEGGAGA
jgi:hypothetical protein